MEKMITFYQHQFSISSVGLILMLSASSIAISATPEIAKPKQSSFFEHFDTNKDLKVTIDEFITARSDRFNKDDTDGNGTLSRMEYVEAANARQKARKEQQRLERRNKYFTEMDTNKDGIVDEMEFITSSQTRAKKSYANIDKDKNGSINSEEYAAYRYQSSQDSMSRQFSPYRMFKDMDTNKDDQISLDELNTARMKWFDSMDKNGDKVVTPEEVTQARKEREKERAKAGQGK